MNKLKVGFIGMGFLNKMGSGYASQFSRHPLSEVSAMCDIRGEVLERNGREFGIPDDRFFMDFRDLLDTDIDIVVIATPIPLHAEAATLAMKAGKHVLSEVTMASTVEDCFRIVETQRQTGKTYMMAENYCYFHFVRQWKKTAEDGRFGKIYHAEGEYLHSIRHMIVHPVTGETYWRAARAPLHYCSHNLGPLLSVMNDRIVKATAIGKGVNIIKNVGIGAIDIQAALFETEKGASIKLLRSSVLTREPGLVYYGIYGTKGCVETTRYPDSEEGLAYFEGEEGYEHGARRAVWRYSDPDLPEDAAGKHGTSEYFIVREFLEAVTTGRKPEIDAVRASEFTIPGLVAHEAAMKGNVWLDVPQCEA